MIIIFPLNYHQHTFEEALSSSGHWSFFFFFFSFSPELAKGFIAAFIARINASRAPFRQRSLLRKHELSARAGSFRSVKINLKNR